MFRINLIPYQLIAKNTMYGCFIPIHICWVVGVEFDLKNRRYENKLDQQNPNHPFISCSEAEEQQMKYLPGHLLIRYWVTCELAVWIVKLTGVHMDLLLLLC